MSQFRTSASHLALMIGMAGLACAMPAHGQTIASPTAAAEPAAPEQSDSLADIIVTAQKRSQNVQNVPMSITALSGSQLIDRGITNVQDLTKVTPGLSFVESGIGVPVYSLRGVGFFDTSIGARPTVTVYVDEAPLPFSVMAQGASLDLDRVEVLKGPQGTLFGSNSTGGAINYIAAKPKADFGAGLNASYARFNVADVQGYVTGPIASNLNARLAARSVIGGDWQKSYTRDDSLGQQEFLQGRLLLDWSPSDALKISLNVNGFLDRGDTQAGQFVAFSPQTPTQTAAVPLLVNYPVAPANDRAADWDVGAPLHKNNHFYQASLRGDYSADDHLTITALTAYSRMKLNQLVDADSTNLVSTLQTVAGHVSSFSGELRATGNYGPLTAIVGANYARDISFEDTLVLTTYTTASRVANPPINALAPFTRQRFTTKAIFGNVDYNLSSTVTVHGAARYTQTNLTYSACTRAGDAQSGTAFSNLFTAIRARNGLGPVTIAAGECDSLNANLTPGLAQGRFNQNNVSWRAGLDFKPMRGILLYANASKGYKAGSVPGLFSLVNVEYEPVNQESVLAYEAGIKSSLFDRLIDLNAAVFNYQYSDKQLKSRILATPNIFGPLEALVNVPKSRVRGAEGQIILHATQGLTLSAAGTYIRSKVTSNFTGYTILATVGNFKGEAFPYTPKWQLNFDGTYKFPISDELNGTFSASYAWRSKTNSGFGRSPILDIDSYGLLDLRAGIGSASGKWSVQVFGRNVTNTYYWTNVAKIFDVARRLAGQPATYGVQLSLKY